MTTKQFSRMYVRLMAIFIVVASCGDRVRADVLFPAVGSDWRVWKGRTEASTPDLSAWRLPEFDDSQWATFRVPIYYSGTSTELPFHDGGAVVGTLLNDMQNNYTCLFMRKTFSITNAATLGSMSVQVAGDDGFVVWLNGVEIGRANMPAGDTLTIATRAVSSIVELASLHEFTPSPGILREGTNVLAVQGFNWDPESGDFGIMAGASTSRDETPPAIALLDPADGTAIAELNSVTVEFGEAVWGVDATDLLVNGQVANSIRVGSSRRYTFEFPSQPKGTVLVAWASGHGITDGSGNPFAGGTWAYRVEPDVVGSPLISEFMADNDGGILDGLGAASDWIEIYNPTGVGLGLAGWKLRDGTNEWTFPPVTLPSGGYLVIFCSGTLLQPYTDPQGFLHTNFKLDADGEALALLRPDGSVVSEYAAPGPQRSGISFGLPQNVTQLTTFDTPARLLVPLASVPGSWNSDPSFDDRTWMMGQSSAGFGTPFGGAPNTVAYRVHSGTVGNQDFGGSLGMDFVANQAVMVSELGCFDDGGNGLSLTITVQLWRRAENGTPQDTSDDTGAEVLASATFSPLDPGSLFEGSRFKPLPTPLSLPPGAYTLLAWGYGGAELNGNLGIATSDPWETQSGSGALSFVGTARAGDPAQFPVGIDSGPANRYAAGTFRFAGLNDALARTSLLDEMFNVNSTAFMRTRFTLANAGAYEALTLALDCDDGCVVWLNGAEVARRNAPLVLSINSAASAPGPSRQSIPLNPQLLVNGTNLLAIHGLNLSASDADFFMGMNLSGTRTDSGAPRYFSTPTPGGANPPTGVVGYVADTKFSVRRGFYDAPFNLEITNGTPGAVIRYTLDGSIPSLTNGQVYTGPIRINSTSVVRASAFKAGFQPANVDTHSYLFARDVAIQPSTPPAGYPAVWTDYTEGNGVFRADYGMINPITDAANYARAAGNAAYTAAQARAALSNAVKALPVISITTDKDNLFGAANGMYLHPAARGEAWERNVSVEWISTNANENWHASAGMHIMGLTSRLLRVTPKLSFMLVFNSQYGNTWLTEPAFGPDGPKRIKRIALRSNARDSWAAEYFGFGTATYIRDGWVKDAVLESGEPGTRHRYCHVFLNGLYWGLYNPTERPESHWAETTFGGEDEDYDVINLCCGNRLDAGDFVEWQQLLSAAQSGLGSTAAYQAIQGNNPDGTRNTSLRRLLGVDSFIGFAVAGYHHASVDWPGNFFVVFDNSAAERTEGWRFVTWDTDLGMPSFNLGENKVSPPEGFSHPWWQTSPGVVDAGLRQNSEYRLRLADRVYRDYFNRGAYGTATNLARWRRLRDAIQPALYAESARWGDYQPGGLRTVQDHWLPRVNGSATTWFNGRNSQVIAQLRAAGMYPAIDPPLLGQFGGTVPAGYVLSITNPNPAGSILLTLDGADPRMPGGASAPTALIYTAPLPLTSPTMVRARVRNGSTWSALTEAHYYPPQDYSQLQLSELLYNPPKLGPVDGDEFEFVELRNAGTVPLELSSVRFTDGISFTFPNETVLDPGHYFVIARNAEQFAARFPGVTPRGFYTGKLENNGESVTLVSPHGQVVFSITYDNAAPWPTEADNSALSLQRMNFSTPATNAAGWLAATPTPGAPPGPDQIDLDGDNLPDSWESSKGVTDPAGDDDGDGLSNYQEYIAGTEPRDEDDRLRLEFITKEPAAPNPVVVLGFNARSNHTYSIVYRSASASNNAPWSILARIESAATNRVIAITNQIGADSPTRFFRLATPRLP